MTYTLALCLDAPMQSWGLRSRFQSRDTAQEPTKSGVLGLLAAALGIPRDCDAQVRELAQAKMGVRVDREGLVERDYQTASNVPSAEDGVGKTVVSHRYYLADAVFLVVLEHPDRDELVRWHAALSRPHWPIYLGRKAFVPARPVVAPEPSSTYLGVAQLTTEDRLDSHGWLENRPDLRERGKKTIRDGHEHPLRILVDTTPGDERAEPRRDVPMSFHPRQRLFATRSVRTGHVPLDDSLINAGAPSCI